MEGTFKVLQHPDCKLVDLKLYDTGINDEGTDLLGTALVSSSVSTLDLQSSKSISSEGWQTFMNQLSQAAIEKLNLFGTNIGGNGLAALTRFDTLEYLNLSETKIDDAGLAALANLCGNLKSLDVNSNRSITSSGWQSFFNSLRTREAQLVTLGISGNRISDVGAIAMSTLKTLRMNGLSYSFQSDRITPQGWQALFTTLQDSDSNELQVGQGARQVPTCKRMP